MFWTPVTRHRYALDWLFILDPFFTGISLATLVLTLVFRDRARRIALVGSGLLVAYIAACAVLHDRALAIWKRIDRPAAGARIAVLPQFLSPFRWLGLSESGGEIRVAFFDIGPFAKGVENPQPPKRWRDVLQSLSDFYPPPSRAKVARYEKPGGSPALEAARRLPDWRIYLAFARFPLETVYPEPGRRSDGHHPGPALPAVLHGPLGAGPGAGAPASALRLPGPFRPRVNRGRAGLRPRRALREPGGERRPPPRRRFGGSQDPPRHTNTPAPAAA